MEQPIYADILFAVNFSMDFLTLFIVAKIRKAKIRRGRFFLSALTGATYGVAAVFLEGNSVIALAINLAVSALMCYIAFGEGVIGSTAIFYLTGCLLGGGMTVAYRLTRELAGKGTPATGELLPGTTNIPLGWMAVMAILCGALSLICERIAGRQRREGTVTVEIRLGDKEIKAECLVDSGNLLEEPISGRPVVIITEEKAEELVGDDAKRLASGEAVGNPDVMRRIRYIPVKGFAGNSLVGGFIPDSVRIGGEEKDFAVAVGKEKKYGGCSGIAPIYCGKEREKC